MPYRYECARGEKSPFHSYLQTLPEHEHLPHLWSSEAALEVLVGTELEEHAATYQQWMRWEFTTMIKPLLGEKELSGLTSRPASCVRG